MDALLSNPNVMDMILSVVAMVISLGWAWIRRQEKLQNATLQKAMDCIAAGVQASYDDYVRSIKDASADGKLTDEERRTARDIAMNRAIAYAKNQGVDLLKVIGADLLPMFMERYILKMKGASADVIEPEILK